MNEYLEEILKEIEDEEVIVLDGLDNSIVGITSDYRLIYDYELIIDCLIEMDNMDYDEAIQWVDYNIEGVSFGKNNPIIMHRVVKI